MGCWNGDCVPTCIGIGPWSDQMSILDGKWPTGRTHLVMSITAPWSINSSGPPALIIKSKVTASLISPADYSVAINNRWFTYTLADCWGVHQTEGGHPKEPRNLCLVLMNSWVPTCINDYETISPITHNSHHCRTNWWTINQCQLLVALIKPSIVNHSETVLRMCKKV